MIIGLITLKYTNQSDNNHKTYHTKSQCVHGLNSTLDYSLKDLKSDFKFIKTRVSEIISLGIEVHFVTIMFKDDQLSPQVMAL